MKTIILINQSKHRHPNEHKTTSRGCLVDLKHPADSRKEPTPSQTFEVDCCQKRQVMTIKPWKRPQKPQQGPKEPTDCETTHQLHGCTLPTTQPTTETDRHKRPTTTIRPSQTKSERTVICWETTPSQKPVDNKDDKKELVRLRQSGKSIDQYATDANTKQSPERIRHQEECLQKTTEKQAAHQQTNKQASNKVDC